MLKIDVTSKAPALEPAQITAWIDRGGTKSLAARGPLQKHPGWEDVQRRLERGTIGSPYLSSSSPPLLVLPGAAAKYYPDPEAIKAIAEVHAS